MTKISVQTGFLLDLASDENKLRTLYFETKYSAWRKKFIHDNSIRMHTAIKKKQELMERYFEMEGKGEERKLKYSIVINKEDDRKQDSIPILKDGKTREEYDAEYQVLAEKENSMII